MAFETNNFSVAKKISLEKSEFSVECNISAGENVAKVLSVSLATGQVSCETLNGVINYSGVIDTKLIFLSDDGQLNTACSSCPFSSKFENENIENNQCAIVNLKIIDYNVESINCENVKIVVTLEQCGFIVANKDIKTISSVSSKSSPSSLTVKLPLSNLLTSLLDKLLKMPCNSFILGPKVLPKTLKLGLTI